MNSFGVLFLTLLALVATINALNCRPLTCLIACPNGFELDAQGCPICRCHVPLAGSSTFSPKSTRRLGATGSSTTARPTPTRPTTTRRASTTRRH